LLTTIGLDDSGGRRTAVPTTRPRGGRRSTWVAPSREVPARPVRVSRPPWLPTMVPPLDGATTRVAGRPARRTAVPARFPRGAVTRLPRVFAGGAAPSTRPEPEVRGARLAEPRFPSPRCCLAAGARRAGAARRGADARGAVRWGARWVWVVPESRRRARRCSAAASSGADQAAIRRRLENTKAKRRMMSSLSLSDRRADTRYEKHATCQGRSARNPRKHRKTVTRVCRNNGAGLSCREDVARLRLRPTSASGAQPCDHYAGDYRPDLSSCLSISGAMGRPRKG